MTTRSRGGAVSVEFRVKLPTAALPDYNARPSWSAVEQAKIMLADGYHIEQVQRRTGVGAKWLRTRRDGYAVR